jgi:membrane protease YdiL (CAAX protease family)
MKKWGLRTPRMFEGMSLAAFKPKTGMVILIALAIYIAYSKLTIVGLVVYGLLCWLGGSYHSVIDMLNSMLTSQGVVIFSLFITSVLTALTLIYLGFIEKRALVTAGLSRGRILRRYGAGFGLGAFMLLLCYVLPLVAEAPAYRGLSALIPVYLLGFVIQSSSEEIFFRGFLMTGIAKRTGIFFAVLISSAFFSLAHALNGGYSLLGGIYYLLIGAFLALLMLRTNSIWASCGFHAAWNFTIGLLAPINIGGLVIDYAIFDVGEVTDDAAYSIIGDPYYLILIALFLIGAAMLLFVGKNRLAARVSPPQPYVKEA